ncbi:hypothetical protein HK100_004756 [Physocladia obscura]|uniref:AAA+ ATPase domain-containing protein n=1 Tax=Physocladia obscura TaxID=109957 RepID=A0AAD5TC86_9FUNG|nr:hypothetical protein HK100_004756 [Physocladia obscura]
MTIPLNGSSEFETLSSTPHFSIIRSTVDPNAPPQFLIEKDNKKENEISLFSTIKLLIPSTPLSRRVSPHQLYFALGRFRSLALTLKEFNESLRPVLEDDDQARYAKHHAMNLFSSLGFRPTTGNEPVSVSGLDNLIDAIEKKFKETIESQRAAIEGGNIEFDGLGELYVPGSTVVAVTNLAGGSVKAAYRVRESWFEETKTLFGIQKCFKIRMETVVSFGTYFAVVEFEEVYSGWTGAKVKTLQELGVATPIREGTSSEFKNQTNPFKERGTKCIQMTANITNYDVKFLEYSSSSFFIHGRSKTKNAIVPSSTSGRIVIDGERGLLLGHYPSQGSDEVTLAIANAASRYKRVIGTTSKINSTTAKQPPFTDNTLLLFKTPPEFLHAYIWPALVGFSFAVKAWGHVLIDSLHPIQFKNNAFDQLVLEPSRKKLIKALVRFGGKSTSAKFEDIVAGKAGGSVFLLHGPPGVGKTLTAEAIAELLHKPLYYVTMGELGTNPEEMEQRLGTVLELCSGWDALAIIDEADVFLEKRVTAGGSDVVRNAMVCVMLRLLEYHEGILFLTTNRVLEFDPALESRVTVALRYDHLDPSAREQVWRNLIGKLSGIQVSEDINYAKLAETVLNGRQIKNAVRLALALAEDEGSLLTQNLIEQTMAITSIGRQEMITNAYYI